MKKQYSQIAFIFCTFSGFLGCFYFFAFSPLLTSLFCLFSLLFICLLFILQKPAAFGARGQERQMAGSSGCMGHN